MTVEKFRDFCRNPDICVTVVEFCPHGATETLFRSRRINGVVERGRTITIYAGTVEIYLYKDDFLYIMIENNKFNVADIFDRRLGFYFYTLTPVALEK